MDLCYIICLEWLSKNPFEENDMLPKAYHYYRGKNQLDFKGLERIEKKKNEHVHIYSSAPKVLYLPIRLQLFTANENLV